MGSNGIKIDFIDSVKSISQVDNRQLQQMSDCHHGPAEIRLAAN
jgi:hypothetical protein